MHNSFGLLAFMDMFIAFCLIVGSIILWVRKGYDSKDKLVVIIFYFWNISSIVFVAYILYNVYTAPTYLMT